MGESKSGETYLLVVKDDASKLVWLFPTKDATAVFVKQCLLQWFAVFLASATNGCPTKAPISRTKSWLSCSTSLAPTTISPRLVVLGPIAS